MSSHRALSSMLPRGMEGRAFRLVSSGDDHPPPLPDRPPEDQGPSTSFATRMASNAETDFQLTDNPPRTVRAVTPDPPDAGLDHSDVVVGSRRQPVRPFSPTSPHSSPRSIPGATGSVRSGSLAGSSSSKRRGLVFNDPFGDSLESSPSSPPQRQPSLRPRTHTMDGGFRQQTDALSDARNRVGSFSSSGSLPTSDPDVRLPPMHIPVESLSYPSSGSSRDRIPDLLGPPPVSAKDKERKRKSGTRTRLVKRTASRPTSPLVSPPPYVDSLPLPIQTPNPNKVIALMRTLCGRMRGEVEYQGDPSGPWHAGICYVDEEKGSLMFDPGDAGSFHVPIMQDLRGCRVLPVDRPDSGMQCLEVANLQLSIDILLQPLIVEHFELWLAALLCWQQVRPPGSRLLNSRSARADNSQAPSSLSTIKEAAVIKIGKVMLWDKGLANSPQAIVKRPSTRDLRSSQDSWRRVSCILQDNGELKLMTENDVTVLSVIDLSQLARCAIQRLDRSVLDEEHCIGIFPIYAQTSTQLSIFRPVYLALESRILFEVWFVILRAFTVPDVYRLDEANTEQAYELTDLSEQPAGGVFRVEKTITVRVTEAKFPKTEPGPDRNGKADSGGPVGNYLAEVMLDGEVRARTTTKLETKNPFWREDCEFFDLPSALPSVSVVLKRVGGDKNNSAYHQNHSTPNLSYSENRAEVVCGSVDIPLQQTDRGKEREQWLPIRDERQHSIGTMLVKVQYDELVVLLSKEYQPLSEMLHKFSSGLTVQIAEALPRNLRRVSEILLNIFQVSGTATEWLMNLVEDEIDRIGNQASMKKPRFSRRLKSNESLESASDREQLVRDMGRSLAGEANLLFRGNSLLTQALEFHMRRLGKEYLIDILSDKISEMNKLNPNCEVDPSKLQPGEDLNQHWTQLLHLTTEIWECISSSADRVPPELRYILKYIRAVAEDRYGDFLRTVTYTSVSGFLFLRFICPAILNPKLFGLLRDHPRPGAQRTLTLIAKGLQALANLSTIGKKETWMEPMNRFLNSQRQSLKDFLDRVCAIPIERTNVVLPASYSTPITILGRLSPLAREGFPSLPYLIDHARNFSALVKLWVEDNPIVSTNLHVYDSALLDFNSLAMEIHKRAAECQAAIESLRASSSGEACSTGRSPLLHEPDFASLTETMERINVADTSCGSTALPSSSSRLGGSTSWSDRHEHTGGELRPPGSSGSDVDSSLFLNVSGFNVGGDSRGRRGSSSLRYASGGSEVGSPASGSGGSGGTMRGLRNGKHARKFLSGFMRKARAASPDAVAAYSTPEGESGSQEPVRYGSEGGMIREWEGQKGLKRGGERRDQVPIERYEQGSL
ncbi:hypothetical protein VTK73DRAFT_3947 [Phialemonium thermophilum]|uniref:Ras-GAP domain-containing protein n=1 Tax=Phialemonium thermophilum TaxID=223376 RepID=A0ABR3Y0A7_9PEZI